MTNAREKILKAANKLYYTEGVRAVSVDRVAEKAGVTKKTLYYHFRSKDDLIAAYLSSRDQPNLSIFKKWYDDCDGPIEQKVGAIFDNLETSAQHPKWRGCGFLRTIAELADMPGHPAVVIGAAHKKKFEAWLADEFRTDPDLSARADALAEQILVVMDGAFSTMLTHRDAKYIKAAGNVARQLVVQCRDSVVSN